MGKNIPELLFGFLYGTKWNIRKVILSIPQTRCGSGWKRYCPFARLR